MSKHATPELQKIAEFSEHYGMGPERLRKVLTSPEKITRKNTKRLLEAFQKQHPRVASWTLATTTGRIDCSQPNESNPPKRP